jgi:hypothetical protein
MRLDRLRGVAGPVGERLGFGAADSASEEREQQLVRRIANSLALCAVPAGCQQDPPLGGNSLVVLDRTPERGTMQRCEWICRRLPRSNSEKSLRTS